MQLSALENQKKKKRIEKKKENEKKRIGNVAQKK